MTQSWISQSNDCFYCLFLGYEGRGRHYKWCSYITCSDPSFVKLNGTVLSNLCRLSVEHMGRKEALCHKPYCAGCHCSRKRTAFPHCNVCYVCLQLPSGGCAHGSPRVSRVCPCMGVHTHVFSSVCLVYS